MHLIVPTLVLLLVIVILIVVTRILGNAEPTTLSKWKHPTQVKAYIDDINSRREQKVDEIAERCLGISPNDSGTIKNIPIVDIRQALQLAYIAGKLHRNNEENELRNDKTI